MDNVVKWYDIVIPVVHIAGTIFNIKKLWFGFVLWIIANCIIIYATLINQMWGMFVLNIIYLFFNAYGIYAWKVKK